MHKALSVLALALLLSGMAPADAGDSVPAANAAPIPVAAKVLAASNAAVADWQRRLVQLEHLRKGDSAAALTQLKAAQPTLPVEAVNQFLALECFLLLDQSPPASRTLAEPVLRQTGIDVVAEIGLRNCYGSALEQTGDLDGARLQYEQAKTLADAANKRALQADALGFMADLLSYQGQYVEAVAQARNAQLLVDAELTRLQALPADDPQREVNLPMVQLIRSGLLQKLANVYMRLGETDKAIEYFQEGLVEATAQGNVLWQIIGHYNIGRALEESGQLDDAWTAQWQSLSLAIQAKDDVSIAWSNRSLGAIRALQGRFEDASPYLDKALRAFQQMDDAEAVAQLQFYRAKVARSRGKLSDAQRELQDAVATFRSNNNLRFLDRALWDLAQVRHAMGASADAMQLSLERETVHKALDSQIQDKTSARLRAAFDAEKKEQENRQLLEQQKWQKERLASAEQQSSQRYTILVLASVLGLLALLYAVRQLRIAGRMRAMALTDELTKIPNRRSIYAWAEECWVASGEALAVIIIDIDYFKKVNDRYGHAIGDLVLQKVAQCCRDELRQLDRIGRVGGEEFMVVLPGAPLGPALEVAERLRQSVAALPASNWPDGLSVSISLGVAVRQSQDHNLAALVQRADNALYRAKAGGRNRVESADETG